MLRLASQVIGSNIISVHAGGAVGKLGRPIINPHNLTVPAFWVEQANGNTETALMSQDIREFSFQGCVINHEEELTEVADLIRLQELIKINYDLIGKDVRTESKKKLGKVEEYVINMNGFVVQKIHVKPPAWKSFSDSSKIIDRSQIVEVDDNKIVVKDASVKESSRVAQPVPNS